METKADSPVGGGKKTPAIKIRFKKKPQPHHSIFPFERHPAKFIWPSSLPNKQTKEINKRLAERILFSKVYPTRFQKQILRFPFLHLLFYFPYLQSSKNPFSLFFLFLFFEPAISFLQRFSGCPHSLAGMIEQARGHPGPFILYIPFFFWPHPPSTPENSFLSKGIWEGTIAYVTPNR